MVSGGRAFSPIAAFCGRRLLLTFPKSAPGKRTSVYEYTPPKCILIIMNL